MNSTKQRQLAYWTAFNAYVAAQGYSVIRPQEPHARAWTNAPTGRGGFTWAATTNQAEQYVHIRLQITGPHRIVYFRLLKAEQTAIETELGEVLTWRELPENETSVISLTLELANPADRADWPRQHQWILNRLEKFHQIFAPRISMLDVANSVYSPTV